MNWNPKEYHTQDEYLYLVSEEVESIMFGKSTPVVNGVAYMPLWFLNREIRIFWEDGILDSTAELVGNAVLQHVKTLGAPIDFTINLYGNEVSALRQLSQTLGKDGSVDEEHLFNICLTEAYRDPTLNGSQHGDIIITKRGFKGDPVSWGASRFTHGTMVLALHSNRQRQINSLKNVVFHETGHLLGISTHCDDFQNVEGYHYDTACNMHGNCLDKPHICPKCRDFISQHWAQVLYFLNREGI